MAGIIRGKVRVVFKMGMACISRGNLERVIWGMARIFKGNIERVIWGMARIFRGNLERVIWGMARHAPTLVMIVFIY